MFTKECIFLILLFQFAICKEQIVDVKKTLVWGPGLKPDSIVLPARYFFIHAVDESGTK